MDYLSSIIDFALHVDVHLDTLAASFGLWSYAILFLIVLLETGLVVTPFLPGDSLLFAAGALAARGSFNVLVLWAGFTLAAIAGDTLNYWVGHFAGERLLRRFPNLVKPAHMERTRRFFDKYGTKTIVLARFVPIVRTIAPFVAGVGSMHYGRFIRYNIIGGLIWTSLFLFAGYYLAHVPLIKDNFSLVLVIIIGVSVVPPVIEYIRERRRTEPPAGPAA